VRPLTKEQKEMLKEQIIQGAYYKPQYIEVRGSLDVKIIKFYSHFIDLEEISMSLNSCSPYSILNLNLI